MHKQTNVLNFPGAEPMNQQNINRPNTEDPLDYWDAVWNITVSMKEEYQEQDVMTWEDYVNTVVDQFVKASPWVRSGEDLKMLGVTNNYYAWLDYGADLGTEPTHVMARFAMVRDVLDFCDGMELELQEEE